MKNTPQKFAVVMTDSSSGAKFVGCDIYGAVKVGGKNHEFIQTKIWTFKREHPVWFWVCSAVGVASGLVTVYQFFV